MHILNSSPKEKKTYLEVLDWTEEKKRRRIVIFLHFASISMPFFLAPSFLKGIVHDQLISLLKMLHALDVNRNKNNVFI